MGRARVMQFAVYALDADRGSSRFFNGAVNPRRSRNSRDVAREKNELAVFTGGKWYLGGFNVAEMWQTQSLGTVCSGNTYWLTDVLNIENGRLRCLLTFYPLRYVCKRKEAD